MPSFPVHTPTQIPSKHRAWLREAARPGGTLVEVPLDAPSLATIRNVVYRFNRTARLSQRLSVSLSPYPNKLRVQPQKGNT